MALIRCISFLLIILIGKLANASPTCELNLADHEDSKQQVLEYFDKHSKTKVLKYELEFFEDNVDSMANYSSNITHLRWYRTQKYGSLLLLVYYDGFMGILKHIFSLHSSMKIRLQDVPLNCFKYLDKSEKEEHIRKFLMTDFNIFTDGIDRSDDVQICINDNEAEGLRCCKIQSQNGTTCSSFNRQFLVPQLYHFMPYGIGTCIVICIVTLLCRDYSKSLTFDHCDEAEINELLHHEILKNDPKIERKENKITLERSSLMQKGNTTWPLFYFMCYEFFQKKRNQPQQTHNEIKSDEAQTHLSQNTEKGDQQKATHIEIMTDETQTQESQNKEKCCCKNCLAQVLKSFFQVIILCAPGCFLLYCEYNSYYNMFLICTICVVISAVLYILLELTCRFKHIFLVKKDVCHYSLYEYTSVRISCIKNKKGEDKCQDKCRSIFFSVAIFPIMVLSCTACVKFLLNIFVCLIFYFDAIETYVCIGCLGILYIYDGPRKINAMIKCCLDDFECQLDELLEEMRRNKTQDTQPDILRVNFLLQADSNKSTCELKLQTTLSHMTFFFGNRGEIYYFKRLFLECCSNYFSKVGYENIHRQYVIQLFVLFAIVLYLIMVGFVVNYFDSLYGYSLFKTTMVVISSGTMPKILGFCLQAIKSASYAPTIKPNLCFARIVHNVIKQFKETCFSEQEMQNTGARNDEARPTTTETDKSQQESIATVNDQQGTKATYNDQQQAKATVNDQESAKEPVTEEVLSEFTLSYSSKNEPNKGIGSTLDEENSIHQQEPTEITPFFQEV